MPVSYVNQHLSFHEKKEAKADLKIMVLMLLMVILHNVENTILFTLLNETTGVRTIREFYSHKP